MHTFKGTTRSYFSWRCHIHGKPYSRRYGDTGWCLPWVGAVPWLWAQALQLRGALHLVLCPATQCHLWLCWFLHLSCPTCLWVPIHQNRLPVKVWGTNKHLLRQIFWSRSANEVSFAQTSLSLTVQQPWRADAKYFLKPLQLSELLHLESKDRTVSLPLCLVYTDGNLFEKRMMEPWSAEGLWVR